MLIDTHCHFDFDAFNDDRAAVWNRCLDNGINQLIVPGISPEQWPRLRTLCEQNTGWFYAVGLHPWWIGKVDISLPVLRKKLIELQEVSKCVAIGECGLDAIIDTSTDKQLAVLEAHLRVASELELPVILHCVKAQNELLRCLKKFPSVRGVVHGFSGSRQLAEQFWEKGFYIGVGGVITYTRANKTRTAIAELPLESLLLETDAPDMPLFGNQGQRNSPEYLPHVAAEVAALKNISVDRVEDATTENAHRLFNFPG